MLEHGVMTPVLSASIMTDSLFWKCDLACSLLTYKACSIVAIAGNEPTYCEYLCACALEGYEFDEEDTGKLTLT